MKVRDNLEEAREMFWMLWWHGSFPLRFVAIACGVFFVLGLAVGMLVSEPGPHAIAGGKFDGAMCFGNGKAWPARRIGSGLNSTACFAEDSR